MKKTVSQFEFAILEIADPERAKDYRPLTDQEETQKRVDNITRQMKRLRVKPNPNQQ